MALGACFNPQSPRAASLMAAAFGAIAALSTLLGWATDTPRLTDWFGVGISMLPNAAIGVLLLSLAVSAAACDRDRAGMLLAAGASLLGLAVLSEHAFGFDLGIDRLVLARPWGQTAAAMPGRMGVPASASLVLLGGSLLFALRPTRAHRHIAATLAAVVLAVTLLSLVGYLFKADRLYSLPRLTGIALQAATALFVLALGVLRLPALAAVARWRRNSAAAVLLRRTLPAIIALPLALGWLSVRAQRTGSFDAGFGMAVVVLALIVLFVVLLWLALGAVDAYERRLHANAQRLEGVLSSIGDGFQVVDAQWRFTYFNSAMRQTQRSHGLDPDALLGRRLFDVFPVLAGTQAGEFLMRAMRERVQVSYQDFFAPWQRWFDVEVSPTEDGGLTLLTRDITEARRDSERLRASEERMRLAMAIANAATWDADLVSGEVHWSDSHYTILGYTPGGDGQASDKMWADVLHPDDVDRVQAAWSAAQRDRTMFHSEHRLIHRISGAELWVKAAGEVFRDEHDAPVRSVGVFFDITEQKRAELALQHLAAELQETDRNKDVFLATLAHELRNPLAPLVSGLDVLDRAMGNREVVAQVATSLRRQVNQMVRLVGDLLDASRITRNKLELRLEPVDMSAVLQQAVETILPAAHAQHLRVDVQLPSAPVIVLGDGARLAQVVGNLLTNACKFSAPEGEVSVAVEVEAGMIAVSVRDQGAGIAADALPRIFEMFYQAEGRPDDSRGGLGIGLALARQLVELHGGTIRAASAGLGQGAEFTVELPLSANVPSIQGGPAQSGELPQSRGRRVLVVDDNPDIVASMSAILELLGTTAAVAFDGLTAAQLAHNASFDVILLDIGMPGLNGRDTCRRIRDGGASRQARIIAVSGWGTASDVEQSLAAGFDGHWIKPVTIERVVALMESLPSPDRIGAGSY